MGRRIIIQPRQKIIEINELQLFTDKSLFLNKLLVAKNQDLIAQTE
jgi:hypothetical protein